MVPDQSNLIWSELSAAASAHDDWSALWLGGRRVHIAVMAQPFLDRVLDGSKTVESRLSRVRAAPYNQVAAGDLVLLKHGVIVGCFTVAWAKFFDLADTGLATITAGYGNAIQADANFWRSKADACYATLLGISHVSRLTPVLVSKHDRRGWLTLPVVSRPNN